MASVVQQLLTGKDNETHDILKWLAVLSFLMGLGLTAFQVLYRGSPFDLQSYGLGIGALFVSIGAALKLKEATEPGA